MDTSSDSLSPVELLAEEFLDRQQRGENPTIEEYCQRHPDLAEEIHDVFEGFLLIEDLKPGSGEVSQAATGDRQLDGKRLDRVGDYRIIREVGRGGMGIVYEAEQESLRRRVALKVLPKQHSADEKSLERFQREARAAARMHHTNIVPVFEVGNDDQWVFYAMQLIQGQGLDLVIDDLNRIRTEHSLLKSQKGGRSNANATAKEPPAHSIAASLILGRFQQENLAGDSGVTEISRDLSRQPQADISDSEPLRAYAQTTVEESGSTASAVLPGQSEISSAENHRNQYFNSVAQIGLQTARALSYAHARGIIHRDIKPSNLLLDAAGIVWVTDFGLAKTGDEAMTHTGDILGTIRYMSPERFRGQCDVRADLYSLGLTLYEMLVLKPAFSSPDRFRLIELVTKTEPPLPRSLDPKIPRDLETIVLKCIDKDARRRYQSADELAEDLQHFVNDEPIKARRISLVERFGRWSRRNKALAAAMAVAVSLLLVINVAGPLMYLRQAQLVEDLGTTNVQLASKEESLAIALEEAGKAKDQAIALKVHAIDQQKHTRRNLYFAHMNMAQAAHNSGDFARQQELLDNWQTTDEDADLRGFEWYYLNSQASKSELIHTLRGHKREVRSVAWSRDGKWIASGGHYPDNALSIWDAKTGKLHRSIDLHRAGIWGIDWHPTDNNLIATASTDRTVRVIDLTAEQEVWRRRHTDWAFDVKWSPDGTRVASCGKDGNVHIWDSETGEQLFSLDTSPSDAPVYYWSLAWHPEGKQLAVSSVSDSDIRIWRFESGDVELLSGHSEIVRSLDWRQDGLLASSGEKGEVVLWDVVNREKKQQLGDQQATRYNSVQWNPADDTLLLTGGGDNSIRIWNTESGENVDTILRHVGDVEGISWSPDGRQFVSASEDGTLKVWEYSDEQVDFSGAMQAADWNPDGSMVAVGSKDGAILLFDSSGTHQLGRLVDSETPSEETRAVQFSSDGRWLASGGGDGYLRIWDIKTKTLWKRSQESDGGKSFPTFEVSGIRALAWHPEENLVVTLGWDDLVRVWDSTTIEVLERLPIDDVGLSACFSPDGRTMVTGIHNPVAEFRSPVAAGSLTLWDTQTWTIIGELDCDGMPVHSVQFTSDGTRLAACSRDVVDPGGLLEEDLGWIRIWEIDGDDCNQWSMTEIARRAELFQKLAWTADGKRLMTASIDGHTRLWDASSPQTRAIGRELLSFPSRSEFSPPVALSSDGTKLAVVSGNSLEIHDALPGYRKAKSPLLLPGLENRIQLGTATSKDFLLKAEIYAAQGDWTRAGQAAEAYLALDADASWVLSDTWIAGHFRGDLSTTHGLEQLVHADNYSPPDIDEKGQPLWQALQKEPGDLIDFRQLEQIAESDEQSFVYAFQRIYSPVTQYAAMLFGNGDFHQLWINGELLSEDKSAGPFEHEEFAIPVKLNPGWNSLLVKVANESGSGQGLALRLSSENKELIAVYEKNGQFDQAVKLWDLEVKAHPEDRSLLLKRAAARWNSGEHTGADRDYSRFLTGREQDVSALIARAKSYSAFNRVDDALADLDQALMSEPNNISVRKVAASVCLNHDRAEAARAHYESFSELEPDDVLLQITLAIVTLESGHVQEYESLRTRFLTRWQDTQSRWAFVIAWAALATPIVGQDLEFATKLNEVATKLNGVDAPIEVLAYGLAQKGLVLYRHSMQAKLRKDDSNAEQYLIDARQALEKGIDTLPDAAEGTWMSAFRIQHRYILAMVLHHLGDDQALDVLNECELEYQLYPERRHMDGIYVIRSIRREALQTIQRTTHKSIDRSED